MTDEPTTTPMGEETTEAPAAPEAPMTEPMSPPVEETPAAPEMPAEEAPKTDM